MGAYDQQNQRGEIFYQYDPATDSMQQLAPAAPTFMDRARGAIATAQSTFVLSLTGGRKTVPNMLGKAAMVHVGNGIVYFQPDNETLYEVVEVAWDGPLYEGRIVTEEQGASETNEGRKGRVTGAVIGGFFGGPAGALVGAAIGTGKKSRTEGVSRSQTYQEMTEVPAQCRIYLERLSDRVEILITTDVLSDKAPDLLGLVMLESSAPAASVVEIPMAIPVEPTPMPTSNRSAVASNLDIYDELKKLKELLDLGILTQEEFDERKRRLLG